MKLKTFNSTDALLAAALEELRAFFPVLGSRDGIMLSGGRTPLELYRKAAGAGLATGGILFLSDERYVPPADPQSNYGGIAPFFNSSLLRVKTELPIEEAAQAFHNDLKMLQRIPLGLLGLGADGHTASLFSLSDASRKENRLAIPVIRTQKPDRISVTPALLANVERILILATGEEKRLMIRTLLEKPETIPAGAALAGHPQVEVWTDLSL